MKKYSLAEISPDIKAITNYKNYVTHLLDESGKRSYTYRMMCVKNGSGIFRIRGKSYRLNSGDIMFFPPNDEYETVFDSFDCIIYNVFFDFFTVRPDSDIFVNIPTGSMPSPEFIGETVEFIDAPTFNQPYHFAAFPDAIKIIENMFREFNGRRNFYKTRLSAILCDFIIQLERFASVAGTDDGRSPADIIIDYINDHCEEKLSGDILSKRLNYHPNYINRLITRATGRTLHKYILDTKLRRASYLLSHSEMSITEISGYLGFYDSSHFTNVFTSSYGITPSQYRAMYH